MHYHNTAQGILVSTDGSVFVDWAVYDEKNISKQALGWILHSRHARRMMGHFIAPISVQHVLSPPDNVAPLCFMADDRSTHNVRFSDESTVINEAHRNAQPIVDVRLGRILDRSIWSDHENAAYDAEMLRRDEAVMEFDTQHPIRPLSAVDEVRRNYIALSTPRAVEQLFRKGDVLFDSGSNCCISNDETDFCALHLAEHNTIGGLAGELNIQGYGLVSWTFASTDRLYRTLVLPCNFVPTAKQRIASPQIILQAYPDETISVTHNSLSLSGRTNESTYGPYFPTTSWYFLR